MDLSLCIGRLLAYKYESCRPTLSGDHRSHPQHKLTAPSQGNRREPYERGLGPHHRRLRQGPKLRKRRQRCRPGNHQTTRPPQCQRPALHAGARQRPQSELRPPSTQGACLEKLYRCAAAACCGPHYAPAGEGEDLGAHGRVDRDVLKESGSGDYGGRIYEVEGAE